MLTRSLMKRAFSASPKRIELKHLPYEYGDLEPVLSGEIMELHYSRHHRAYVNNLNNLQEQVAECLATGNMKKIVHLT